MDSISNQLKNSITFRYAIALSLIAILATVAFFTLRATIQSTEHTGYIVNISGKQRMLSQHIALDVYRIRTNIIEENNAIDTSLRDQLSSHAKEMLKANEILSTGKLPNGSTISLSQEIYAMYFKEMDLASRVKSYANTALSILETNENTKISSIKKYIDANSEILLRDLNKVVYQYQVEGEKKLKKMQDLETLIWTLTLLTLLLEVIFIFQPMVRKIMLLSISNEKILSELELTIELRTSHLENANKQLKHMASHDPLTGLRNRLKLETSIERVIQFNKKHDSPYAVLMLDIDWFKSVNDTYGHNVGDQVLIELALVIQNSLREDDKIFRAGGEEFVVLLHQIDLKESEHIAEKIRLIVEEHIFNVDGNKFTKTISCGLFHSSLVKAQSVRDVLKLADTALYESKAKGRNQTTLVRESMNEVVTQKITSKLTLHFDTWNFNTLLEVNNEDFEIDLGISEILSKQRSFLSLIHEEDRYLLENLADASNQENPFSSTIRVFDLHQKVHICRVKVHQTHNGDIELSLSNATKLAQTVSDKTLIINLHAMLENTNDYIYFKDRNHVFTAASETLVSITSVNGREEFIGTIDYDVFPKDMADEYFKLERDVFDNKLAIAQDIQPTIDNNGNKAWVDNRKYPIYDSNKEIIGLFGIARVISDYEYKNLQTSKETE